MDKAKRAALLRERFKKVVGGFAFRKPDQPKPRRYAPTRTPFRFVYPMGFAGGHGFPAEWVTRPEEKPTPTVSTKHRKGVPAVTMIAAKANPQKLARQHTTAEGLLSERRQQ